MTQEKEKKREPAKSPEEARKWIKKNWSRLVDKKMLGSVLKRYYKLLNKSAGECWEEVKELAPGDS